MTEEITHKLSKLEQIALDKFKKEVKALHGKAGTYTYKLTPTGIGVSVIVYSHLAKIERDITDIDSW